MSTPKEHLTHNSKIIDTNLRKLAFDFIVNKKYRAISFETDEARAQFQSEVNKFERQKSDRKNNSR